MKVFFDTNILVAAFVEGHPYHERAAPVVSEAILGKTKGNISSHSILELHSALTQLPKGLSIPPQIVRQMIQENILPYLKRITLTSHEYETLQKDASEKDLVGGLIYDFLHLRCAEKAKVERFYTFNVKHFQNIASTKFIKLITAP